MDAPITRRTSARVALAVAALSGVAGLLLAVLGLLVWRRVRRPVRA